MRENLRLKVLLFLGLGLSFGEAVKKGKKGAKQRGMQSVTAATVESKLR